MHNDEQFKKTQRLSKYILFLKLFVFMIFFIIGLMFNKFDDTTTRYILIGVLVLLIFAVVSINYINIYLNRLARKDMLLFRTRIAALTKLSENRIGKWHNIARILLNIKEDNPNSVKALFSDDILRVRDSINSVISTLGQSIHTQLFSDVRKSDLQISIVYLQKDDKNGKKCIRAKNEKCVYIYPDQECEYVESDSHFTKNDGSAAGTAWHQNKMIIIPDTDVEMRKEESKRIFKKMHENENIQSIICAPIKYENLFFGVFCIAFNVTLPMIEQDPEFFAQQIDNDMKPIVYQLTLIEIVKLVKNLIIEKKHIICSQISKNVEDSSSSTTSH